ncbi:Thiamine biosynthesis lipoprotein ApbE [Bryocella elongata]|uniref:FAD:protein FMN transferase n=1 Tax=Bryocella elongata TaxID=863522 RepID=A0A1H6CH29_9BACT|nr:DUF2271 domain-containing protein [Bryocella elongata]SEG72281.1 Thiamine biosynthesis lipoprotein ApbE [Bryocella elongata]
MRGKTRRLLSALSVIPMAAAPLAQNAFAVQPTGAPTGPQLGAWSFHHENVLGTSLQMHVSARDEASAARAEAAALGVFDRQRSILSAWDEHSEFSRWERTRFEAVPVSNDLFAVLAAFDTWRDRTGGALDPSVEAATRLWKSTTAEGRVPTAQEIAATREAVAQPHWILDAQHKTATRVSDTPLALASFAKSWITAKAADAALAAGATGIMLNVGGDVVARGAMTQVVSITDPRSSADNDRALTHVVVADRTVATSGDYRRGFSAINTSATSKPTYSHLIDPRTAQPTSHVLSSTVIAKDAETAGALATAFSVLTEQQSAALARNTPGVDYMLVLADGSQITSPGWSLYEFGPSTARYQPAGFAAPQKGPSGMMDPSYELTIDLNLQRIDNPRYRRPYVAVWIEDADHYPVRTLALWFEKNRWLPELKQWYKDDQVRTMSEGTDISRTVSSATRAPGHYTLKWDGKDNTGKPLKAGKYTVVIEAAREHGGYDVQRREISFIGKPEQATIAPGQELGEVTLDYRKR